MSWKIKYPTLITSELQTHHLLHQQMIDDVNGVITAYNRKAPEEKLQIHYRGKTKVKVIKGITTTPLNIGQVPCILLCVQEYKTGQDDITLQRAGDNNESEINSDDKLGSNQNYALLYPLIDQRAHPGNKWLIIMYATPGKDEVDLVNTIKNVVNKLFKFPFKYVIPMAINNQQVIPKVEVTLSTIENVDNDQFLHHDLIVSSSSKSTKKVEYANISPDAAEEILCDNRDVDTMTKRVVRIFHDALNKSAYTTYTATTGEDGAINTIMTTKYSDYDDVEPDQMNTLYDLQTMRIRLSRILTNYLSNGADGQDRANGEGHATGN